MTRLIDYYKVLAVPPDVDLIGVENAYVRLSDEIVRSAEEDEGAAQALQRLNEAYSVLANAETRRQYDRMLFAAEYEALERRLKADARRRLIARQIVVGALVVIVAVQAVALYSIGGESLSDGFRGIF
jgi:curved DNA-binding protein CbpA